MEILNKEKFLKTVAEHEMKVMLDAETGHRHLTFSKPDSSDMHFHINTWNGYLNFSGDMGAYLFSRTKDMFQFFRSDDLGINTGYWAEKCQSACTNGGVKVFSSEALEKCLADRIEYVSLDLVDEYEDHGEDYDSFELFTEAVKNEMTDHFKHEELDQYRFISVVEEFESEIIPDHRLIDGDYEWLDFEVYSYRYQWCCYAIVWAIQQYDIYKDEGEAEA
tara:strand:- start:508 stop:1167 length:660 start_codon:yes stop_codon:yes gene_type:complete